MALALALLLLALSGSSSPVVGRASDHGDDDYMIVAMSSLKLKSDCLGHRVTPPVNSTWMPLDLPAGPCSSSPSDAAAAPSVDELLRQDQLRADEVQKRLSHNGTVGDDEKQKGPANSKVTQVNHLARIKVELGSRMPAKTKASQLGIHPAATGGGGGAGSGTTLLPGVIQTVVLDTASDVPWVQCVPCPIPPCHPQTDTFYDPTNSGSYAAFSCSSAACRQLGPYANGCANGQCQYRVTYPDGSYTSGTYSSDVLTLNPTTMVNNFKFGCSHADQGSFDNQTAGIMALGGGPESLISQTAATYGRTFSYCLPPTASYVGFFALGAPSAASSSRSYVVTPMLRDRQSPPTFYRVLLRAVTVAGRRVAVPAESLAAGGAVLDSRTVITRLPPTAYAALRAAFRDTMRAYRAAAPKGTLDTCYDFRGVRSVKLPRVTLVFDRNAAVELDPSGILFNDCLAFAANRDDRMPAILGNVQQQTIEVLYDVDGGAVGFRRNAC